MVVQVETVFTSKTFQCGFYGKDNNPVQFQPSSFCTLMITKYKTA
jgi:hypothetical protein